MPLALRPEVEAKLGARAEAAGVGIEVYIERIADDGQAAAEELESLALEGLHSGEPIEAGLGYWEAKHCRLDERFANIRPQ